MGLKFRKNTYKIIIIFLICLMLAFLYLGNYNFIETFKEHIENNTNAQLQKNVTANGGASTMGSATMIGSANLNAKLTQQNPQTTTT